MIFKTATSLAFAAACVAAAAIPAQAQPAGTYGTGAYGHGPQTYQGGAAPNWSGNAQGSPNWSAATPGPQPYQPQSYQQNMAPGTAGTGGTNVVTNGPQANPGDMSPSWSARRNVEESQRYDRLLETNRSFRQARMHKECGPITDPELRQQCLASFGQEEPYTGSSTSHGNYRSESGR